MKKLILVISLITLFIGCKKSNDNSSGGGGTSPATAVTAIDLMASSGKRWQLDKGTLTYYSAGGAIDSTVTLSGSTTPCSIYFTDNRGVGGLNLNYDVSEPLPKALPKFGVWALNQTTQKLTLTCLSPYCNGTDGEWSIIYYAKNYLTNGEWLQMERTLSLAAGRKVMHHLEFVF